LIDTLNASMSAPQSRAMKDLIQPDRPAPANVLAFSTTRGGGFSAGPWRSLNLGDGCGDDPVSVGKNRQLLRALLPSEPRWLSQVHGVRVLDLDCNLEQPGQADACTSAVVGQVCAVLTADCLPVLLCNRTGTKIAAAHAGWRGLAGGVLEATVAALGCRPGDLLAWLGPAIGPEAFEVGQEVVDAFTQIQPENAVAFKPHGNRWLADLYTLARLSLKRVGVKQVWGGQYCTHTEQDKFFSYRRDGRTGRMATIICSPSTMR